MTGRTALFVARDASNNGTTPVGARLALGGLLAGNGASPLDVRAGVLVDNGGAIASGTANMSYNVRPFRAVSLISTANGPTIGSNDATVNVVTTAAPGSNSRIDLIWAKQHHVTGDGASDTDVVYEIGVTQGTVAASPTAPATPSGAVALYTATVTAGVTATSGLTFTRVHNWTVANGGVVPVITSGERTAISAYAGLVIWYQPDLRLQVWNGTAWQQVGAGQANPIWHGTLTASTSGLTSGVTTDVTSWVEHATHSRPSTGVFSYSAGVVTVQKTGLYEVKARIRWASNSTGSRQLNLAISGTTWITDRAAPASTGGTSQQINEPLYLTSGQTLKVSANQSSGGSLTIDGDPANGNSTFAIEYLGTPTV